MKERRISLVVISRKYKAWLPFINELKVVKMKKNLIFGILISFAMTGVFGGISFAADKPAGSSPAVETVAKAEAHGPRERSFRKRGLRKRASRKGFSSRARHHHHHKRHHRFAR